MSGTTISSATTASLIATSFRAPFHLAAPPSFYAVRHSGFLGSLFDIRSHGLQDCPAREVLPRSETMAETTPLLPRANRPPHDLSIFLPVCHSPWPFLSQYALLAVRAFVASFLSIVFSLDIVYGINYTQRGNQLAFEASNVSLVIQIFYYWTTTVGVSPLRRINPLISSAVLDTATYLGTLWSITFQGTSQGEISSPDTSGSFGSNVN